MEGLIRRLVDSSGKPVCNVDGLPVLVNCFVVNGKNRTRFYVSAGGRLVPVYPTKESNLKEVM